MTKEPEIRAKKDNETDEQYKSHVKDTIAKYMERRRRLSWPLHDLSELVKECCDG